MAVGTTAAVIGAVGALGSSAMAAKAQKDAAKAQAGNVRNPNRELTQTFDALEGIAPRRAALMQQYMPRYTAMETQRDSAVRGAGITDAEMYAPRLQALQEGMNPEAYRLVDATMQSAREGIESGGALNAEQQRDAAQQARAAFSQRGLATGQSAAFSELLNLDRYRRQRLGEDRQYGLAAAGLGLQARGQAIPSVLGMSGQGYGQAAYQQADPTGSYFSDAYNTNLNAAASRANASANNQAALWGAGISGVGNIAGAYLANRGAAGTSNPAAGIGGYPAAINYTKPTDMLVA